MNRSPGQAESKIDTKDATADRILLLDGACGAKIY